MLQQDLVEKVLRKYEFDVELGKIREFCLAIGEKNPIYFDLDTAKEKGYEDIPAPLTFPSAIQFWGYPEIWEDMKSIGIDIGRLLHLKEEYKYFQTIYPGKIFAETKVSDVKTGKMNIVSFETLYKNLKEEKLVQANMSIVIRP